MTDPRRQLPSVDRLLQSEEIQSLLADAPHNLVVSAIRDVIGSVRDGRRSPPEDWVGEIRERVAARSAYSLHPVLNATGVVLHTNLGRAPLAERAIDAMSAVARDYSTLEFDLATGARGSRTDHCAGLLAELTSAEAALVVNNAAGALVLALNALATGREVVISRGELIEIGGSFRIPDILGKSGARLREVGTTNRTHLQDYAHAIGPDTGAILTVHRSNFEQRGFVANPEPTEVARLATERGIPYVYDVGSGLLADLAPYGLRGEPRVVDAVSAGADLVLFSGDKLLGGPQAGCLVGRNELVAAIRRNPYARAMRADKMTLAALEATLAIYRDPEAALKDIPILRMLTTTPDELAEQAERLRARLPSLSNAHCIPGSSAVGGGSFPGCDLPTTLVAVEPGALGADGLALRLRIGAPAIVTRVAAGRVLFDPRTLPPNAVAYAAIADALEVALST